MSRVVSRVVFSALLTSTFLTLPAFAQPLRLDATNYADRTDVPEAATRVAAAGDNMGGGFIEFLFGGGGDMAPRSRYAPTYRGGADPYAAREATRQMDPIFLPQTVAYEGPEKAGTIIIDTPQHFLFLVQGDGTARRYGIGVGRPGFTWAGVKEVTAKREWPDWRPPVEMLKRRPDLPTFMAGGPENPLGARAMYLGSTLYRIHGSNEPWTIGTAVSSGCIRMRNEDVIDLYERVKVGTRVIVI
jgi:lipoprotein-anchoring transpeptidase ErfK/SrfK